MNPQEGDQLVLVSVIACQRRAHHALDDRSNNEGIRDHDMTSGAMHMALPSFSDALLSILK